ncbi:aldo/keto reductase [Actinomycetaceae bacterium L2_0104]
MRTTTTLPNGTEIPLVGLGLWEVPADSAQKTVEDAVELGYRHFDGAAAYKNEEGLGAGIRACGVPREQLFVTTKLQNANQGYSKALAAFDASLERLGLDYVDLYLIHWPVPKWGLYLETWKALEEIYESGRAKAIGVANFTPATIAELAASASVQPMVNQFESHPSLQQRDFEAASRNAGMVVEAYSPIGRGVDLKNPVVQEIAAARDCTPAQAILAWHLAQERVIIPKSVHRERLTENLAATQTSLTDEDLARIDSLEAGLRQTGDPETTDHPQL